MTSEPLVVIGGGGFGRETIDVVRAVNRSRTRPCWQLVGVLDDALGELGRRRLDALAVDYLGPLDALEQLPSDVQVAVGVGDPLGRERIALRLAGAGRGCPELVHPGAEVGSEFRPAPGLVVCAGVSVGTNVRVGRHVHLNPHAVIGHDAVLDDFVSINPNATISGECVLETRVLVGAGAVVLQGRRVGHDAVVGAGACVTGDVEPERTVVGVPARAR